jgi:D-alanyl-D-alanine carboxypeptidase/D-alanyl-D-alanine-endopeptidase (penicillin-binding protein 4)
MPDADAPEKHGPAVKPSPFAGVIAGIRSHRRAWIVAAAAVGFIVVGTGVVAFGATVGTKATAAVATTTPTPTPTATVPTRPVPSAEPAASRLRTCSVATLAQDPRLGTLEAQVINAKTGEVLFDRSGSTPAPTASVMKVLTSAAALSVLGPNYRVPTTVVQGSAPGTVVLIGGGDVTLSRLPTGQASFYTNAPHLDDLANQVLRNWKANPANANQPITNVIVDTSLFSGPVWLPSWDEHEEREVQGSTPYMTALMVDGDRNNPTAVESPRSTDPIGRAANDFAADLGGNVAVTLNGKAPAGAAQLGMVQSQPVTTLIQQAMEYSDNTIMEMLARLVAIKEGAGNTFAAEQQGTTEGLQTYGIPTTGITVVDGSGLSNLNAVPPSYIAQLMIKVLNRTDNLGIIYDGLPVSGVSGTLGPGYDRFQGSSSVARGAVNAKTGWIGTAYTLGGVIHAKDGTALTFAVFALNKVSDNAKAAIDSLVAGMYECGDNLSNN